jgi:hypothetical protein
MTPLPFAPPPKDSSLYQQLESTTLQTLTADQLATIRAKTFSQGTEGNEDEYRRMLLLAQTADVLSTGDIPIAGTQQVNTLDAEGEDTLFYLTPGSEGTTAVMATGNEIWKIAGINITNIVSSGGTNYYRIYAHDSITSTNMELIYSTSVQLNIDSQWNAIDNFFIDSRTTLALYVTNSSGVFTSADVLTLAYRVR